MLCTTQGVRWQGSLSKHKGAEEVGTLHVSSLIPFLPGQVWTAKMKLITVVIWHQSVYFLGLKIQPAIELQLILI